MSTTCMALAGNGRDAVMMDGVLAASLRAEGRGSEDLPTRAAPGVPPSTLSSRALGRPNNQYSTFYLILIAEVILTLLALILLLMGLLLPQIKRTKTRHRGTTYTLQSLYLKFFLLDM